MLIVQNAQTAHSRFWFEPKGRWEGQKKSPKWKQTTKGNWNMKNMKNRNRGKFIGLGLCSLLLSVAASTTISAQTPKHTQHSKDIVDTALSAGQFKTLAAALEAAGLIEALKGAGHFTVFAPTDEAFAKLPAGTVESLLQPENKEKLKAILLYHVVSGNVKANKVLKLNGRSVKTLQGTAIKVQVGSGVRVNDANVTATDISASNGVIHVIDRVLLPSM